MIPEHGKGQAACPSPVQLGRQTTPQGKGRFTTPSAKTKTLELDLVLAPPLPVHPGRGWSQAVTPGTRHGSPGRTIGHPWEVGWGQKCLQWLLVVLNRDSLTALPRENLDTTPDPSHLAWGIWGIPKGEGRFSMLEKKGGGKMGGYVV